MIELSEKLNQQDYKLIKKHTDTTFKELLQEKKLSRAAELIKSTSYSIIEIMTFIGCENPTYFYKIFKSKFGTTPRDYKLTYMK